jgi:hypothetical protein
VERQSFGLSLRFHLRLTGLTAGEKRSPSTKSTRPRYSSMPTEEESTNRRRFIENHRHSSAIEDIAPSDVTRQVEDAYLRGDLTEEQFSDYLPDSTGTKRYDHKALAALGESLSCGEIDSAEFLRRYDEITI